MDRTESATWGQQGAYSIRSAIRSALMTLAINRTPSREAKVALSELRLDRSQQTSGNVLHALEVGRLHLGTLKFGQDFRDQRVRFRELFRVSAHRHKCVLHENKG